MDRYLSYLGLIGYLFIGTAAVLIPSVMPFIVDEFATAGLTLAAIGLIFPARALGGIVGNLLSGIGSDMIGRRRLGWIAIFMQRSIGFSTFFSVAMISIFYVALTTGRFICAAFAERLGYATTLLVLAFGLAVTYPLVVLDISPALVVAGVFLTGLSLSGLFPIALAYGARLYPEQTGALTGTLSVAMALGSMAPPLWTGVIADMWSFHTALGVNYIMVLPLVLAAFYLGRAESRQNQKPAFTEPVR